MEAATEEELPDAQAPAPKKRRCLPTPSQASQPPRLVLVSHALALTITPQKCVPPRRMGKAHCQCLLDAVSQVHAQAKPRAHGELDCPWLAGYCAFMRARFVGEL